MQQIPINRNSLPLINKRLEDVCKGDKPHVCEIKLHDDSLKARQRALANIWYKDIAQSKGVLYGESEAFCKYRYGLKIRCENDPDLDKIIRRMLDGYSYEQKLKIIEIYSEWFPILRDKNGMTSDQQGRYLHAIQTSMAEEGIFLSSSNDKGLISYPESKQR